MSCRCDEWAHPGPRAIAAGLTTIPRQPGDFADYRRALLHAASAQPGLALWRSRAPLEFGVLLLEVWAYVLDVTGFYDETIAHECYVRTARQQRSLHRLVELIGYVPRPAVAASVALAALAGGPDGVLVPAGTGFRSGGAPPQVFELDRDTRIEPRTNGWPVLQVRPATLAAAAGAQLLVETRGCSAVAGDVLLVSWPGGGNPVRVLGVDRRVEADGATYRMLSLDRPAGPPAGTAVTAIAVARPTQSIGLWKLPSLGGDPGVIATSAGRTTLVLDGLQRQVRSGDPVIISDDKGQDRRFRVAAVSEVRRKVIVGISSTLKNTGGTVTGSIVSPDISMTTTTITLDTDLDDSSRRPAGYGTWGPAQAASLVVRTSFVTAARVTAPLSLELRAGDPVLLGKPVLAPPRGELPGRFLLAPTAGAGADVTGVLDAEPRRLTVDAAATWAGALGAPVILHGNVLLATRGETVRDEVLGVGDETTQHQRFTLVKKPLTYLRAAGSDTGSRSTLEVRVSGRRWLEVATLYGQPATAEIFIARPREDGGTDVVFGGFGRGSALPTGAVVSASYRFGAGAGVPPVRSITQLARPVVGLRQVRNPVAPWGGTDAEGPESLRRFAPRSALLLGRAVSIDDMEVVASGVPGVRVAHAQWRWSAARQRPVAHISYVGAADLATEVVAAVRALTDPATAVQAEVAMPERHVLVLDVSVDPALTAAEVADAVRATLHDGDDAALAPQQVGIGAALFRSVLFDAVLAVPGTVAVLAMMLDGTSWDAVALQPAGTGWLDFVSAGSVAVHGTSAS